LEISILGTPSSPLMISAKGPSGIAVQATPAQIQPGAESNKVLLSFTVSNDVAAGTYPLNVTVSSQGQTDAEHFSMEVVKYLVVMVGESFVPTAVSVPVGSTVYWVRLNGALSQYDDGSHNVVFSSLTASSPTLAQYQSWSYMFAQAGTFAYSCTFHPGMNGQVTAT
jgi:plastocyanin